jgi:hypothetical protein
MALGCHIEKYGCGCEFNSLYVNRLKGGGGKEEKNSSISSFCLLVIQIVFHDITHSKINARI